MPTKAPARPAPRRGILATAQDFIGDVTDNALPNMGDELAGLGGGIGSLIQGRGFRPGYDAQSHNFREAQKQYDHDHPTLSWVSTLGGAGLGLGLPAGKVLKGATRAQKVAQGAKVGAAYGGLAGAADGEGLAERGKNATIGALSGAAIGSAAPAILTSKRVQAAGRKVGGVIQDIARDTSGEVGAPIRRAKAPAKAPKKAEAPKPALKAVHYSFSPDITETDPSYWLTNKTPGFTPREERAQKGRAPDRTYFGLVDGDGVSKPYRKERGVGPYAYEAELDPETLADMNGPARGELNAKRNELPQDEYGRYLHNDRSMDSMSALENTIKDEGFAGYRHTNPNLGDVAVSFQPQKVSRIEKPLEGAPTRLKAKGEWSTFGPYDPLRASAREYTAAQGLDYTPPTKYRPVDEDRAKRLADAYADMKHDPTDPDVHEAYSALKNETMAQLQDLQGRGFKFNFADPANPPYENPQAAMRDLRDNKRMQVFPTDHGFGEGGITDDAISNNPLLEHVPGITWDGKPIRYNDAFRAVHDAYGHAKEGFGFRANGEDNAALQHLPTFSPPAQRALLAETRGQNSYVNYGPDGEFNRTANEVDTKYAPQKAGILPDDVAYAGTEDFMPDRRGQAYGSREVTQRGQGSGMASVRNDEGLQARLAELGHEYTPTPLKDLPDYPIQAPNLSTGGLTAEGVLSAASSKRKPGEGFADWRKANDSGPGTLFDYSDMSKVPDVPQVPMDRYQPARGPSGRIQDALNDPRVINGINGYVARGAELGGKDWYNTEPLLKEYIRTLGKDKGPEAFGRFMDTVAATSPRSTVPDNIRTASYFNHLRETGQPIDGKIAPGYGSIAQGLHQSNMGKLVEGGGWDIYTNPKPASFSTNLQGNYANATIDTHNFRLPGILSEDPRFLETSISENFKGTKASAANNLLSHYPKLSGASIDEATARMGTEHGPGKVTYKPRKWHAQGELPIEDAAKDPALWATMPNNNEYAHYEDWQRKHAADMGMSPAQYQSSMWVGAGDATGLASPPEPFLRTFEARVKYTADRLGVDPRAVLDKVIKGEIPLLSAGAVPTAGALHGATQDDNR